MTRQFMLGAALCVALGVSLGAETVYAKAADASGRRPACHLAAAAPPLKLLHSTVLVENGVRSSSQRLGRRANYTPVPNLANAKEQAPFLALLDRQTKPASIIVGVGY
jgi:hypothetical protein